MSSSPALGSSPASFEKKLSWQLLSRLAQLSQAFGSAEYSRPPPAFMLSAPLGAAGCADHFDTPAAGKVGLCASSRRLSPPCGRLSATRATHISRGTGWNTTLFPALPAALAGTAQRFAGNLTLLA